MNKVKLTFNTPQIPWQRPSYCESFDVEHSIENDKVLIPSLKADFQDDILYEFISEIQRKQMHSRFPRDKDASVAVIVRSTAPHQLPMVTKNVLDALNGKAYVDDANVSNVYAKFEPENKDSIVVGLFFNKIFDIYEDVKDLLNKAILTFEVATKPCDKVIAVPSLPYQQINVASSNVQYQNLVKREILSQYKGKPLVGDVAMSFHIETQSLESDLDNICLNHILSMVGVVISNIHQVKLLHMNIVRGKSEKATVVAESI